MTAILFASVGFIVTERNAKYLLAGYNTMGPAEREAFDLRSYLSIFRKFHLFLGASTFLFGALLTWLVGENAGGLFLGVYPVMAYMVFVWKSNKCVPGIPAKYASVTKMFLVMVLVFIGAVLVTGMKEDGIRCLPDSLQVEGLYGESVLWKDLRDVRLVDRLPDISYRSNGFSLGSVRKGYFRTKQGQTVKLVVGRSSGGYLELTWEDGRQMYYNTGEKSMEEVYQEVRRAWEKARG
ncbi:MAG: hypothetical protein RLY31_156 [Bacteroidota bacterium]